MAYQVLARKWRPHNFNEIVGQKHVVNSLINALQHQRLHHAYLFTGTRGVGKTTLARILAKAINCEDLQAFNPCGVCDICMSVDAGSFLDLIEVDAASRTKVEDTRDLLDNAQYAPNRGRYKIYVIDEVHMLSGHSFNALLKTLEEPPEHVKFILATTDPQKIPVTVLSRCLQYNLKSLRPDEIFQQFEFILGKEGIKSDVLALKLLAKAADGSLRDGLSLLDQAIVYGNGSVDVEAVESMLGIVAQHPVDAILRALAEQDAQTMLSIIAEIAERNADFGNLIEQLLRIFHRVALFQKLPQALAQDEEFDLISELAGFMLPEDVQLYYQIALIGQRDLALAPDPKTGFEMLLLRMLTFRPARQINVAVQNPVVSFSHKKIAPVPVVLDVIPDANPKPLANASLKEVLSGKSASNPADPSTNSWTELIQAMKIEGMTRELANNCILENIDDNTCTLIVDAGHRHLCGGVPEEKLKLAIQKLKGKPLKVTINVAQNALETPAVERNKAIEDRQNAAVVAINTDPNVQALKEQLGARIMPGTIEPI